MRRRMFCVGAVLVVLICVLAVPQVTANPDSRGVDESKWDVTSYQVKLSENQGGSGDIQIDQNGWIHLGANHMDGGDIQYNVQVGYLSDADIVEVWIDGYSSSNDLDVGPTVFIGTGKNRYEQITRLTGDAWRPFVFRLADDAAYGDVTDPTNRNENWRTRYPSSKYEVRRIDKSPRMVLDGTVLPIMISMTGVEDFILKRLEVVAYRTKTSYSDGIFIVSLTPYTVRNGELVTLRLNRALPSEQVDFYLIDPAGREQKVAPRILTADKDKLGLYADAYFFPQSGQYQIKLVDRSDRNRERVDIERFEYVRTQQARVIPTPRATPEIACPEFECGTMGMPLSGVPAMNMPVTSFPAIPPVPPMYIAPVTGPVVSDPSMMNAPQIYSQQGRYTIQIGAFQSQSVANALREKLLRNGFNAYISEASQGGKRLYRVRVGQYADKYLAHQDATRLKQSGYDTWVTDLS